MSICSVIEEERMQSCVPSLNRDEYEIEWTRKKNNERRGHELSLSISLFEIEKRNETV